MLLRLLAICALLFACAELRLFAHVGPHPSVHDTVAGVIERMKRQVRPELLPKLTTKQVEALLTPKERHVLGTEHISFKVNMPVTVTIVRGPDPKDEPFWLAEQGFKKSALTWESNKQKLTA